MVSKPLVSIAIPTYNRADKYLKQAIQASLSQTCREIEIIISNNYSSDNTEEVVGGFTDPRIRYFRQSQNIGYTRNYTFCMEQARGPYFLLLPDDDLIDRDFIEMCLKGVNYETNIGLIRTGTRVINNKGEVIGEYPNRVVGLPTLEFFLGWFAGKTSPYTCSTLFNTRRLREVGGFTSKHNLFHDLTAEFTIAARFGRVDICDIKASFRKHFEDVTHAAKVGNWCEDALQLMDLMCDLLPEKKELLKAKGMPFLAYLNYNRAMAVRSTWRRIAAYFIVFSKFGFRYLPARHQLTHKIW